MRLVKFISLMQCQSLIEELSASSSTDLQQRAYELQAVIGLDAHAVENIMPLDASCEDIEVIFNIITDNSLFTILWSLIVNIFLFFPFFFLFILGIGNIDYGFTDVIFSRSLLMGWFDNCHSCYLFAQNLNLIF